VVDTYRKSAVWLDRSKPVRAMVLLGFKKGHRLLMTACLVQVGTVFSSDEHEHIYR
jgi:hypothetical protein